MTSKEKARYKELEAKDCLVDDEDVIDYYRLRCEILEEEIQELKEVNKSLLNIGVFQRQENEKLKQENQELKEEINELSKDKLCFEKQYDKLKKAIEIIKDKFELELINEELHFNTYECDTREIHELYDEWFYNLTKEDYELLKEVLEDE